MNKIITFEDFSKMDLRIGTIIEVNDFPEARHPAYQLIIDFGDLGIKKSSAQITTRYKKEDLLQRQIVAVINFRNYSACSKKNMVMNNFDFLFLEKQLYYKHLFITN
jgi:export-related chaperone CsaA